jgi:oligopeptide/dipeptide ABC transporter ATP-binding protein
LTEELPGRPLLEVSGLTKTFVSGRGTRSVRAVDGVDFKVEQGRTLGLVGESGSGKSTTGRLVLRLIDPDSGSICFDGTDIATSDRRRLRAVRRQMQMVFQDPFSSLDPLATILDVVGEPLEVHEDLGPGERAERVVALLEQVGLGAGHLRRYPAEFSGGQRQRIAIARALALNPRLIVCDEPVSALDVSTQAQVINLLEDLQAEHDIAYLFIAHDLAVVRHASHDIGVMYLGRMVEMGPAESVYNEPKHPYTEALLSAVLIADPVVQRTRKRIILEGDMPSPADPPNGCRFHTRCPYVMPICREVDPPAYPVEDGWSACHLHTEGPALAGSTVIGVRPGARTAS